MSEILEKIKETGGLPGELVIDAHGHLGRHYWFHIPYPDDAAMIDHLDRFHISAVLASHYNSIAGDCSLGNDGAHKAAGRYPGRIIPYVGVNPHHSGDRILTEIERNLKRGFRMLKFHPAWHQVIPEHEGYLRAMEIADEHGLIVKNHQWPQLEALERWIGKYPKVTFIMAHPSEDYGDLVRATSNLYMCFTACTEFGRLERLVSLAGADKVLLGSDVNFFSAGYGIGLVGYSRLSDQDKRKILGLNIVKVLDKHGIGYLDIRKSS